MIFLRNVSPPAAETISDRTKKTATRRISIKIILKSKPIDRRRAKRHSADYIHRIIERTGFT